jgi:hypothetical protein
MDRVRMEVELIGPRRSDELRRIAERDRLMALAAAGAPPRGPGLFARLGRLAARLGAPSRSPGTSESGEEPRYRPRTGAAPAAAASAPGRAD